jgi:carbonic anhydrase
MNAFEIAYRSAGDSGTPLRSRPADADAARRRLDEGSQAFADLFRSHEAGDGGARRVIPIDPGDLGLLPGGTAAPMQRPFAAVLGCADARVPIELIFNEGPNDLFVVRVAGNTLGEDVRGSLRYALEHLGESLKLIVVLGHSGCGAVTAAVDVFLDPADYLALTAFAIRELVDRLQVVVRASAGKLEAAFGRDVVRRPGYREALIEMAVVTNAALAAHTLQREIANGAAHKVRAVYGVYLLNERAVWAPRCGSDEVTGLAEPPDDAVGFAEFGDAMLASRRILDLLAAEGSRAPGARRDGP